MEAANTQLSETKEKAKKLATEISGGSDTEKDEIDKEFGSADATPKKASGTPTGVSLVTFTVENRDSADVLLEKIFKNNLIADAHV